MSDFWKDRIEIHSPEEVTGTVGGDGFAQVCGSLDEDPDLRTTTFRSQDDESILVEVRFAISAPSIRSEPQECIAVGELAASLGALKKGQRLKVIGRYKYREQQVVVHSAQRQWARRGR